MIVAFRLTAVILSGLLAGACQEEIVENSPPRPVRTATVQHTVDVDPITLTGVIQPKDQVDLAFRVGGILIQRLVSIGDRVAVGQTLARLQKDEVQNKLRAARAKLAAAKANLTQAEADLQRLKELATKGVVAKARIELAQLAQQTARANVDEVEAQNQSASDNVGYTDLKAKSAGIVIEIAADAGEVVSAGQRIIEIALNSGKDAVFNVPLKLIRDGSRESTVTITLADDPEITTTGRIREVAPQANAVTGTYSVKVGLQDPPDAMRLGATVIGRSSLGSDPVVRLPGPALTQVNDEAEVWVVDPAQMTVSARKVVVLRYEADAVIIGEGLSDGELVVTAGVHALRPGQEVRLLDDRP